MSFWTLLVVYLVGLFICKACQKKGNEEHSTSLLIVAAVLAIALLIFSFHLVYAFYTLMLVPWFTFLPIIPEKEFWLIYIAWLCLRGDISLSEEG